MNAGVGVMRVKVLDHFFGRGKRVDGGVAVVVDIDGVKFPWVVGKMRYVTEVGEGFKGWIFDIVPYYLDVVVGEEEDGGGLGHVRVSVCRGRDELQGEAASFSGWSLLTI